jgi:histidyl-tRNA synthetase
MLGLDSPLADTEVIFTAIDLLRELGLEPGHVKVKISHRAVVRRILSRLGVADDKMTSAFDLLDRRDKMLPEEWAKAAGELGLDASTIERFNQVARMRKSATEPWDLVRESFGVPDEDLTDLRELHMQLKNFDIASWCEYDLGIVRGLAYYTGTVFEIHEVSGAERAIAGGGRYDQLISMFGGPDTPAVGFGMGDVVLTLVLSDKKLIPADVTPPVDALVFAAVDEARDRVPAVVAGLRSAGLHARLSYKQTTNVGKLMKDATAMRARKAVILDADTLSRHVVSVKDLVSGEQSQVPLTELARVIRGA